MRIPIPERFRAKPVIFFAAFLFLGQQLEGTQLEFSVWTALFVVLFAIAFNAAGGILYASGAFVFFNGVLTALLGLTVKVFLGEPAQRNLLSPDITMMAYCGTMFGTAVAAALNARLRTKKGLLPPPDSLPLIKRAAIGCTLFGMALQILTAHSADGTLGSALRQVDQFLQMGIVLATVYEVRASGGRRSTNWIVWLGGTFFFGLGLLNFGKEMMFIGPTSWLIAAIFSGFNFSIKQVIPMGAATFALLYWFVPYSQVVRTYRTQSRSENFAVAVQYLGQLNEVRQQYLNTLETHDNSFEPHLYDRSFGFLDRLDMLAFDDALIHHTEEGRVFGLLPTYASYIGLVPHFLWKDKPLVFYGNEYGRELGVIDSEDTSTGISFSAAGDAYHEDKWFAIFFVWPCIAFMYFFVTDSLTGSARQAPWAILPIIFMAHAAAEGMMQSSIFYTTYGAAALIFVVLFSRYVLPLVTGIFTRFSTTTSPARARPTPLPATLNSRPSVTRL